MAEKKQKGYDPRDKFSDDGFEVIYNPNKKKQTDKKPTEKKNTTKK